MTQSFMVRTLSSPSLNQMLLPVIYLANRICSNMDRISKEGRSRIMSAIHSKNTGIELALRKELHRRGLRYRIHYSDIPGKPDIVFIRAKVAIFCDSEFWHGYQWEHNKEKIGSNKSYWIPKIERNITRDKAITTKLRRRGWLVLRFWGKEILSAPDRCADTVEKALTSRR